jgi:hypothetical protein
MSNKCKAELRPAERSAFCRGCDIKIERGEYMISFYSWRNRGQHIHLCLECCGKIGDMVNAPAKNTISKEDIVYDGISPMDIPDDNFG